MSEQPSSNEVLCADCAGFDIEWMRQCHKHKGVQFCRGCAWDDYEERGPMDLEDQLDYLLEVEQK